MSDSSGRGTSTEKTEFHLDEGKRRRIRERVLEAEKEKLHLDNPRGIINDIEAIIREEIN